MDHKKKHFDKFFLPAFKWGKVRQILDKPYKEMPFRIRYAVFFKLEIRRFGGLRDSFDSVYRTLMLNYSSSLATLLKTSWNGNPVLIFSNISPVHPNFVWWISNLTLFRIIDPGQLKIWNVIYLFYIFSIEAKT